ncbi:unnamed protein product [Spirodela intermedia]|uniref:Uncharacterized protein n=1 Tax=Spirodela intermedia TaxID=51605 RepID=A0A7I8J6J7_SPIIN|nr:unnamed protein product [Spirodela intermedia]CAA6665640.1 unnamed protein product [Spirodela intermedia]
MRRSPAGLYSPREGGDLRATERLLPLHQAHQSLLPQRQHVGGGGDPRRVPGTQRLPPQRDNQRAHLQWPAPASRCPLLQEEQGEILAPNSSTFSCMAKALPDLRRGRQLHALSVTSGLGSDVFVCNSLVGMYAKCDSLSDGVQLFERMPQQDVVSWNSIISAYANRGLHQEALLKVREMVGHGVLRPDQVTLASALTACSSTETVREAHGYIVRSDLQSCSTVQNALISAYGRCGEIRQAGLIFRSSVLLDGVSWNALISCYARNSLFEESFRLLQEMGARGLRADVITYSGIISSLAQAGRPKEAVGVLRQLLSAGLAPDAIATASVLPAVADLRWAGHCREIHGVSFRRGTGSDRRVANALVSAYGKCGMVGGAWHIFETMEGKDVISWSSMVAGFGQNGHCREALELFSRMIMAEVELNPITITSVLAACAGVSGLRQGREVHHWAAKRGLDEQTFVGSALIDMYAKCGRIRDARKVFDQMPEKNLVTWNAMIGGYAFHGLGEEALEIFRGMEEPDEVSFIAALSACSHGACMERFHVSPREGHYACMVDILGRSGRLERAMELVRTLPMEPSAAVWGSLLGACRIHCNLDLGIFSGAQIIGHGGDQGGSGYYVMVSNMLAEFGRWREVESTRQLMSERGVKKGAGCSWIEVNKQVHSFVAKDREQHPEWGSLFRLLVFLSEQMKCM